MIPERNGIAHMFVDAFHRVLYKVTSFEPYMAAGISKANLSFVPGAINISLFFLFCWRDPAMLRAGCGSNLKSTGCESIIHGHKSQAWARSVKVCMYPAHANQPLN